MIKVHYWNEIPNFGETIIPIIVKWISGQDVQYVDQTEPNKYLIIGSEMPKGFIMQNDIIWGYGNRYNEDVYPPIGVKFLAVRGEYTYSHIKADIPKVLGDPGILMPLIYQPKHTLKEYDIGLVGHHTDTNLFNKIRDKNILNINITEDPYTFIDKINKCNLIITSSLHCCIVAESYGLPVIWLKGSQAIREGFEIKFNDYFSGSGRESDLKPAVVKEYTLKAIMGVFGNVLPKPIFNRDALISAWKNYHKGE